MTGVQTCALPILDDEKRFEAIKAQGLKEFEETYGAEARERYGDAVIDETNERIMSLTRDEWEDVHIDR